MNKINNKRSKNARERKQKYIQKQKREEKQIKIYRIEKQVIPIQTLLTIAIKKK